MLGIPPHYHLSPTPAESQDFPGGKGRKAQTEVNRVSPSSAQGPGCNYPTSWVGIVNRGAAPGRELDSLAGEVMNQPLAASQQLHDLKQAV